MANEQFQVSRFGVTASSGRRFWYRLIERFFQKPVLYLVPVALLTALGMLSISRGDADYKSTGVLNVSTGSLIGAISGAPGSQTFSYETPAATEARKINELLRTDVFVQIVAESADLGDSLAAGLLTLDDVRNTTFAISKGDTLLEVSSTAPSAQGAYRLVTATMDSYVKWQLDSSISDSNAAVKFYEQLLVAQDKRVNVAQDALNKYLVEHQAPPAPRERPIEETIVINGLNDALTRAQEQYDDWQAGAEQARLETQRAISESDQRLRIVDPPQIPAAPEPTLKKNVLTAAIFFMLGLMVAAACLVLSTLADRKVRSQDDLESIPGLEVVGVIPRVRAKQRSGRRAKPAVVTADRTVVAA